MENLLSDTRYALRNLLRRPAFRPYKHWTTYFKERLWIHYSKTFVTACEAC